MLRVAPTLSYNNFARRRAYSANTAYVCKGCWHVLRRRHIPECWLKSQEPLYVDANKEANPSQLYLHTPPFNQSVTNIYKYIYIYIYKQTHRNWTLQISCLTLRRSAIIVIHACSYTSNITQCNHVNGHTHKMCLYPRQSLARVHVMCYGLLWLHMYTCACISTAAQPPFDYTKMIQNLGSNLDPCSMVNTSTHVHVS